jgi:PEP-CTERM motif
MKNTVVNLHSCAALAALLSATSAFAQTDVFKTSDLNSLLSAGSFNTLVGRDGASVSPSGNILNWDSFNTEGSAGTANYEVGGTLAVAGLKVGSSTNNIRVTALAGESLTIGNSGISLTGTSDLRLFSNGTTGTFGTTGSAQVWDLGPRTLTITNSGFYTMGGSSTITVNGTGTTGTLSIGGANSTAFGNNTLVLNSVTLALGGSISSSSTVNTFNGTTFKGNVASSVITAGGQILSGGLTIDTNGNTVRVNSALTGTGALTVKGAGVAELNSNNGFTGNISIENATLRLVRNTAIPDASTNNMTLTGATIDFSSNGFTEAFGTLDLGVGVSEIKLGTSSLLSFRRSDAVGIRDWDGTLSISGSFVDGSSVRFGNDVFGLTSDQLSKITINGVQGATINSSGYLVSAIPEPSTYAALAGLGMLGFAAAKRRRNTAVRA